MKKSYIIAGIFLVALIASFFLGRSSIKIKETIRYVPGEKIRDTIRIPPHYKIEIPKIIYLPQKPIFINGDSVFITDTVGVFQDYSSIKHYAMNIFDDKESGRLDIQQQIQYNQLKEFSYDYTPIQKVVTRTIEKTFTPFIIASYSTNSTIGIGGGTYINSIGVGYQYNLNNDYKYNYHTISLHYKF